MKQMYRCEYCDHMGTEEECYFSYIRIEKEIHARWQPISNLESFVISLPN